jgi:hypothetical protein
MLGGRRAGSCDFRMLHVLCRRSLLVDRWTVRLGMAWYWGSDSVYIVLQLLQRWWRRVAVSLAWGSNRLDTTGRTSSLRDLRLVWCIMLPLGSRNSLKRRLSCCRRADKLLRWWSLVLLVR